MISEENLAQLRALIAQVLDEKLDEKLSRYDIRRKPPEDISEKRRAAARVMLAKRVERAIAEQKRKEKKVNGSAHSRAIAEQKIGDGELICTVNGLRGPVEVHKSYVLELIKAYPDVLVAQELERARIWCDDNPTKRKANVRRFLTKWVARRQERGNAVS